MKCTWPTQTCCLGSPTQPIFHWLAFGFCVGGALGVMQILAFLDTNMLLSPTRNCAVGGSKPTPGPNTNSFASQWNIGLNVCEKIK